MAHIALSILFGLVIAGDDQSCSDPSVWYKDLKQYVQFQCPDKKPGDDKNDHSEDGATCTVICPQRWKPTIPEVTCSCRRPK